MTSLRARLTLSYAALVAVALIGLAFVLTRLAFSFLAQPVLDAVAHAAGRAEVIAQVHPEETPREVMLRIRREVSGNGVIVLLPPPDVPPGVTPPGEEPSAMRFDVASMLGLHARRVPLHFVGTIVVAPDLRALVPAVRLYLWSLGISIVLALVIAWLVARAITAQAIAPLDTVTSELRRFADGDFTPRAISTRDRSELGELIAAYNGAAAQVSAAFGERVRNEEQMRRFVADAGHELRTPLTVVSGFVDVLEKGGIADGAIRERAFRTLRIETQRMRRLIERLMVLARLDRPDAVELETVDLAEIVVGAVDELRDARRRDVDVRVGGGAALIAGEPGELHEAIGNLVDNALKYGADTPVSVRVAREGDVVIVAVRDGGPGIPPAERAHLFERFFRGSRGNGVDGSGLGLAIVRRAVERSGGRVELTTGNGDGTTFRLEFPAKAAPALEAAVRV